MGDAMSHAVLPGVALSFLFNIPMFIGALATGMVASIFIGFITKNSKPNPTQLSALAILHFSFRDYLSQFNQ